MDLDTVLRELYGIPPEEFAATRKIRAGEAQSEGSRDLAAAIRKLRRPTTSAWLANLLVRECATQITELLRLGEALQRAQADLDGAEIRQLSQRRQDVVAPLSDAARELARELGKDVSEATIRELEETLDAAIANSEAREALAAGHLETALRYSGLGGLDLGGPELGGPVHRARARVPRATPGPRGAKARVSAAPRREAGADEAEHLRRRQVAKERVDRCSLAITEAQELLRSLRREREQAQAELRKAERALTVSRRPGTP